MAQIIVSLILISSTILLAQASSFEYNNPNLPKLVSEVSTTTSSSPSSANVTSVTSTNGYLTASPTTGDVVLTFDGNELNSTIDNYVEFTDFSTWGNNSHSGEQLFRADFNKVTGGILYDYDAIRIWNPAKTFVYNLTAGAITANRTLNIPVSTGEDTIVTTGTQQTITGGKTFSGTSQNSLFVTGTQINDDGAFLVTGSGGNFQYTLRTGGITANRNMLLPILTGTDTFAFLGVHQQFTQSNNFTNHLRSSGNFTLGHLLISPRNRWTNASNILNGTGVFESNSLVINHQDLDITSSVSFNVAQNNTLDRPIEVSVGFLATATLLNDIAYVNLTKGFSQPLTNWNACGFKQITANAGVETYQICTMTIQAGQLWAINSTTGGTGAVTLEKVWKTVL